MSHSKKRELSELIDFLCTQELAKKKKSLETTRKTKETTKVIARTIPSAIRKEIWKNAGGKCQHPKCASKHYLQIHHRVPYAYGGGHDLRNLKLLCYAHQGRAHIIKS